MLKKIFFFFIQSSLIYLCAQELPIGQFKEYLPYNKFRWVAQDSENIYAATDKSILVVDKSSETLEKWSNLNGLSEVGVQMLYADTKGRLFVTYTNSNIDIVKDYKVHNIRDILNKQISGSKTINGIFSTGDIAYFSCDFGVIVLDLNSYLVKDTWFTIKQNEPFKVRSFTIHNGRYYLATDRGVYSLAVSNSNPADFSSWEQENELAKLSYRLLCSYQSKLFAVGDNNPQFDSLFVFENSQWKFDNSMKISLYRSIEVIEDKLLVCDWNHVKIFTGNEYEQYEWEPLPPNSWQNGYCAILDRNRSVWVADIYSGLIHINMDNNTYEVITADGPANSSAYNLYIFDGVLALVPGARNSAVNHNWTPPAISVLQNDHWWVHTDFQKFNNEGAFNSVAINPLDKNEIYIASWRKGLYKVNTTNAEVTWYSPEISTLNSAREDGTIFLSGLAIDKHNNLWMGQAEVSNLVSVKELASKEEKWHTYNLVSNGRDYIAEHILIDSRDYKWITLPRQNELIVLRGIPGKNNVEKSNFKVDINSQTNVKSSTITCIAEDREERIWIGTDQGIKVINDAAYAFHKIVYAKNILLEQNGYTQNLLEFEHITCIAVDAANRKWIGTRAAGVFLVSPTGTKELFHFTSDNSPLFSNQIYDIKINHENGEVFIATEKGLISYKGTATASKENFKEVMVYPNPVKEDYTGPVAVNGLMEDSFCKITDSAGKLVWQGYAYGGQLIWDGKDFNGKRPTTGVYFVMASNKTGKEKKVAKFLFIQ